jgi:hypothetical protein
MLLKGADGQAEKARGFLCAKQARRQVRVAADGHKITSGSSVDVAAENFGGLWRTMARDRRRVACRICVYALTAPLRERRQAEKTMDFSASLPVALIRERHPGAVRLDMEVEQTRCSGASKPLVSGWCRP